MRGRGGIALLAIVAIVALTLWTGRARESASGPEPETAAPRTAELPQPVVAPVGVDILKTELDRAYETLPETAAVEAAGDVDAHHAPLAIFPAAKALGDIRDRVQALATAAAYRDAAAFYDRCARKEGVLPSLRALCLRNLMDLATSRPAAVTVDLATFPSRIAELAAQVPPIEY